MALTKITPQMFDTSAAGHDFNIDNGTFVVDASTNRVGVGTPSPQKALHTLTSDDIVAQFESSDAGARILIKDTTTSGYINASSSKVSIGQTDGLSANNLNIDASGNVGIGDSNPSEKFVVKGDGARMIVSSADMEVAMLGRAGSSGAALDKGYLRLRNQGVTADGAVISAGGDSWLNAGNVGIGTTSPATPLHITGITTFDGDGASRAEITSSTASSVVSLDVGGFNGTPSVARDIRFLTNAASNAKTERMRISSAGHFIPAADSTYNIGANATRFANAYFDTVYGTLATAAQTNITSVGTLTSLTTSGNISVTGQGDFSTQILVGNNNSHFSENNLRFQSAGHAYIDHNTTGQHIIFRTSNSSSLDQTVLTLSRTGNTTVHGLLYLIDGSNSSPALTFSNDNDTGIIRVTTNALGIVAAGSRKFYVNATNAYFQNLTQVQIDSGNLLVTGNITSGPVLINSNSSAFGGSSVQGFNTDFLVDTGQGYSRHNSYHTGGSNHQFLVNATGSTTNTIALAIDKDANATFAGTISSGAITSTGSINGTSITSTGQIITTQESANSLKTRFLMGKDSGNTNDGDLYINYASSHNVHLGAGGGSTDLRATGHIRADNYQFYQNSAASGATESIHRNTTGQITIRAGSEDLVRVDGANDIVQIGGLPAGNVQTHGVVATNKARATLGNNLGDTMRVFAAHGQSANSDFLTFGLRRITQGNSGWNHAVWDITRDIDNTSDLYKYCTFGIGEFIVNDQSGNLDFRVESNNDTHALFVDASADIVYFGASASTTGTDFCRIDARPGATGHVIITGRDDATTKNHHVFTNPNGTVGSIQTAGSATAYNTSSDERLKKNIKDAEDAGSKIDAMKVRQFDWKVDNAHQDYGMVAQELQTVAPEAVWEPENEEDMKGVDYSKLVPMLIKEIQTLRSRVATLEANEG